MLTPSERRQKQIYERLLKKEYKAAENLIKKIKVGGNGTDPSIDLNRTFKEVGVSPKEFILIEDEQLSLELSEGHIKLLMRSLSTNFSPYHTPLLNVFYNCTSFDEGFVNLLIEKGADINYEYQIPQFDNISITLLGLMILKGKQKETEFLLKKGANPNLGKGLTPLSCMIHRNDQQLGYKNSTVLKTLKEYGADFTNIKNQKDEKVSLLAIAACLNKTALVELLLSDAIGMDPNVEGIMKVPKGDIISNLTPLHMAALGGYSIKIVEMLLKAGANPLKVDSYGNTALHLVAYRDLRYMAKLPESHRVSRVNTQNERGTRIIHSNSQHSEVNPLIIKTEGHRGHIMQRLLEALPDKSILNTCVNNEGDTILHRAVCYSFNDETTINSDKIMVRQLILAGAQIDLPNAKGETARNLASEAVESVIKKAIHVRNKNGFFKAPTLEEVKKGETLDSKGFSIS